MPVSHQIVRANIRSCTSCPLHKVGNGPVPFTGLPGMRIMVLGQNPGEEEDREGKPFVGAAGRLMRGVMKEVGIDPLKVWWGNQVQCHTVDNRQPTKMETLACHKHKMAMILACQPEVVLLAGEYSLQTFQPKLKLMWQHGRPFEWAAGDKLQGYENDTGRAITFWTTYHPAGGAVVPGSDEAGGHQGGLGEDAPVPRSAGIPHNMRGVLGGGRDDDRGRDTVVPEACGEV